MVNFTKSPPQQSLKTSLVNNYPQVEYTRLFVNQWYRESTNPDGSPGDVVAVEQLLDIDAVCNETFKRYCAHLDRVRENYQLFTDTDVKR